MKGKMFLHFLIPNELRPKITDAFLEVIEGLSGKFELFEVKEKSPPEYVMMSVKIEGTGVRNTQVVGYPIMQFLSLVEVAVGLNRNDAFRITKQNNMLFLSVNGRNISYEQIFLKNDSSE